MSKIKLLHGDSYQLIKDIPDKSVNLIYVDIPYLICDGGTGSSDLGQRILKQKQELGYANTNHNVELKLKEFDEKRKNAKTKEEYKKWHVKYCNLLNMTNLKSADIVNGIDYKILDEFARIQPYIYIYIYGVVKNKSLIF